MLINQRAIDMHLEGNSNAMKAGQKVKMIIGAENTLIFYISHAHLIKKRVQVCYDHNMPMRTYQDSPILRYKSGTRQKRNQGKISNGHRNENLGYF